jgi:hypothetical protein
MIRGLVEVMIGKAGTSVLHYYEGHALVLGLIIVLYGFLMYFSWSNLVQIYRYLVAAAAETLTCSSDPAAQPANPNGAKRSRQKAPRPGMSELPWQDAVDSVRFPLVSRRSGLLPMRKSVDAARSIIDERELWEHARLVANGADLRRISPEYRLMPAKQVGTHGKD